MLGAIEQVVLNALRAPPAAAGDIVGGPTLSQPAAERISVHARALTCARPSLSEADTTARDPVRLSRRSLVQADADPADASNHRNFTLPADALPDVAEVQSPPGTLAKRGDDFSIEGRVVRFFRNNVPTPIEVVTQGEPANGYMERTACQIDLDLTVWGSDMPTADGLSVVALERTIAAFANRTVVVMAWDNAAGFRVGLLSVRAYLASVTREAETVGTAYWARCTTRLLVRGELELVLATGTADSSGVIQDIIYRM